MRSIISWISVFCISLFAQVLTFVLSAVASGYATMVPVMWRLKRFEAARSAFGSNDELDKIVTGMNDADWVPLREAIAAYDIEAACLSMPVIGWYFVFGAIFGGLMSVLIINIATIRHMIRLAQGGRSTATKLGAFPLSDDAPGTLQQLPMIVEELAAEFHLPMPAIFVMPNEEGMNAFVVGRKKDEVVLVVTKGLCGMSRNQMRGIVAHELAHVRNGDMVHNMRLLAVELGINSVRHTAEWCLRHGWNLMFGASGFAGVAAKISWGFSLFVLGIALWPMGLISSLVGSSVMAMTNRRRELRADALAAKILGSWEPIGDALKRIMGHDRAGRIFAPDGRKLGHLMFAQANGESGGLLATHPKLQRRIRRADRKWDGVPLFEAETDTEAETEAKLLGPCNAIEDLLSQIDSQIVDLFRDPDAAVLTLPALLLYPKEHRSIAYGISDGKVADPIKSLWDAVDGMDDEERFALLDLVERCIKQGDERVVAMLEEISLAAPANAWDLHYWLTMLLHTTNGSQSKVKVKYKNFGRHVREVMEVISIGVSMGRGRLADMRFQRVWGRTKLEPAKVMKIDAFDFIDLEESVEILRMMPRDLRASVADAFVETMSGQDALDVEEATFLRYICRRWGVTPKVSLSPGALQPA